MAAHKYTSWGRTRSPKALSQNVPAISRGATAAVVAKVVVGDLSDTLAGTNAGENGYVTENQRFLHVTVSGQQAQSVVVYVFHYATGKWSALMVNDGDGTFSQATATTANSGTAAAQPQTFIFEIAGADRVGFLGDGTNDPTVHATCTTF